MFQAIVRSDTFPEKFNENTRVPKVYQYSLFCIPMSVSNNTSGHSVLLFLFYEEPVNEVSGVGGDVVERLVLVIVLGDRHIGHRLQVRVTHERREPGQPDGQF